MALPTPHLERLKAALANAKLPGADRPRVEAAIERYKQWIQEMQRVSGAAGEYLAEMVRLLGAYKNYIDLELIFDSKEDFLYRQKGQLKLDNSITEEVLPWLINPTLVPELPKDIRIGPSKCFSSVYFTSRMDVLTVGGGLHVRTKDQDFALSRPLFIRTSHLRGFEDAAEQETFLGYVTAEIKTNLDKTMFQEACATAHDVKAAVAGSKYLLVCEWLDMTPLSTGATDIDEVLILRGAKRLGSDVRSHFSSRKGRQRSRELFAEHVMQHPFRTDVFGRLIEHIRGILTARDPIEDDVLRRGYF